MRTFIAVLISIFVTACIGIAIFAPQYGWLSTTILLLATIFTLIAVLANLGLEIMWK